ARATGNPNSSAARTKSNKATNRFRLPAWLALKSIRRTALASARRSAHLITRISLSRPSIFALPRLRDDIHQGRLAALDQLDCALDRRAEVFGVRDRSFAVHAHTLRELGVGNVRPGDRRAGATVRDATAVAVGHDLHLH